MRMMALAALTFQAAAAMAWAQPTRLNILGRWDRPIPGGSERMCTNWPNEAPGGAFEGQVAYLAADPNTADRIELQRYYNASNGDHMESLATLDPANGYTYEGPLGFVWTSQLTGMVPLRRLLRSLPFDHATAHSGDLLPPDYIEEGPMGYAFPRWLTLNEHLLPLTAGDVTIKSNRVAGGAIWEWHQGGFQYVNDYDYGRQIQGALFIGAEAVNPTEAGDMYTRPQDSWKHGSPLVGAGNDGATQLTDAVPLQWTPELYGGDSTHPVVWLGYQIGKAITLNFNGMPRVARYQTRITAGTFHPSVKVSVPIVFAVAALDQYYTYDVGRDILTPVSVPEECTYAGGQFTFEESQWLGAGAGIVANSSGTRAIGIYGRTGSVNRYYLVDGVGDPVKCGAGTGQYGQQFSAVGAERGPIVLPQGASSHTTYIASGTLAQVVADFRTLYLNGY
jgi:hypothetical protein